VVLLYLALATLLAYQAQQFTGAAAERSPLAILTLVVALVVPLGATFMLIRQLRLRVPAARVVALVASLVLGLGALVAIALVPAFGAWLAAAAVPAEVRAVLGSAGAVVLAGFALLHLRRPRLRRVPRRISSGRSSVSARACSPPTLKRTTTPV
jgi:asparagine N-glycosylation enzyme membrane subunit Stt3